MPARTSAAAWAIEQLTDRGSGSCVVGLVEAIALGTAAGATRSRPARSGRLRPGPVVVSSSASIAASRPADRLAVGRPVALSRVRSRSVARTAGGPTEARVAVGAVTVRPNLLRAGTGPDRGESGPGLFRRRRGWRRTTPVSYTHLR